MLTLPNAIVPVLHPFATLFRNPTWLKAQILLVGVILAPSQRTVASALPVMGLSDDRNYARYHQVLNQAVWSPRQAARILLGLLILHLDQGDGPLIFGIDEPLTNQETLERRRGPKIKSLGIYRDGVRSIRSQVVKASGLRWISLMWLGQVPWAGRYWALPFLTVLAPSARYYRQRGRRHKNSPTGCPASTIFAGWRQSVLPVHLLGLALLLGSVGPVAGDVKLQDDGVVHDPVNRRGGGHGVGKDALPLREDQV